MQQLDGPSHCGYLSFEPLGDPAQVSEVERDLERSRLAAETTLGRESMPPAERAWRRANRPANGERWNVLTSLRPQDLPYAA
jgi:hypothetical protein